MLPAARHNRDRDTVMLAAVTRRRVQEGTQRGPQPVAMRLPIPACIPFLLLATAAACARPPQAAIVAPDVRVEAREVSLPSGRVGFDLYRPSGAGPHPLVVVAHGFWRSRANMAGWGRHLAAHGFVAAVPDLRAWADHERNGRAVRELIDTLLSAPPMPIDAARIAVVGFSAGGLATLLAAAEDPRIRLWVGLDPVDRNGKGVAAAPRVKARPVIVRAEPSRCNANGNARDIERAFAGRVTVAVIDGATHTDPEWPTDWKARLVCGGDDGERRARFVDATTAALKEM
jgi:dienelactone hydrolase